MNDNLGTQLRQLAEAADEFRAATVRLKNTKDDLQTAQSAYDMALNDLRRVVTAVSSKVQL